MGKKERPNLLVKKEALETEGIGILAWKYLQTALMLKNPQASYQDLLDLWNVEGEDKEDQSTQDPAE